MQNGYLAVDKKLIISSTACRLYRVSAWISLALLAAISAGCFSPNSSHWVGPIAQPLLMIGVLAYVSTTAAMEVFLFRFDESGAIKQIFWFLAMLVPLLGAPAYCLLVYSR